MATSALQVLRTISSMPDALEETVDYLSEQLSQMLRVQDPVLICFPCDKPDSIGALMEQAVLRCHANPILWGKDLRWISLLQLAFTSRASTIIAPPMTLLGLSKLAAHSGTPLNIQNAVLTGYPCMDWMMDGIMRGLDCKLWGCFAPGISSIVAGFSCKCGRGIHVRQGMYNVWTTDEALERTAPGVIGRVTLSFKEYPSACLRTDTYGCLLPYPCECGLDSPKLVNISYGDSPKKETFGIMEQILFWSSVLDCRVERTEHGLEVEVIYFPGEKLPKLPDCAKLNMRPWNPSEDISIEVSMHWGK